MLVYEHPCMKLSMFPDYDVDTILSMMGSYETYEDITIQLWKRPTNTMMLPYDAALWCYR